MNINQQNAAQRIIQIDAATAKLEEKLKNDNLSHKHDNYRAKLKEYEKSKEFCEFTLKTGAMARVKGNPTAEGVEVAPKTGGLKVKGGEAVAKVEGK